MTRMVIVNGYPRAGKTTFAMMLAARTHIASRSSIDIVKEFSEKYFGFTGEKTNEYRKFLSDMKRCLATETMVIENDIKSHFEEAKTKGAQFFLVDIREPSEIDKYQKEYDAITAFVDNPKADTQTGNISDASVINYNYDFYVDNSSDLSGLEKEVERFLRVYSKKKLYIVGDKLEMIGYASTTQEAWDKIVDYCGIYPNTNYHSWISRSGGTVIDYGIQGEYARLEK